MRPDINKCFADFRSDNKNFYYALGGIKSVGHEAVSNIVKERIENGQFKSINDFIKRVNPKDINKAIEILRVKGISKASKKMSRIAKEGVVAVSGDEKKTSLIEVNCETDFVEKNDDFINFVKELRELNNLYDSDIDKLKKIQNEKLQNC